MDECAIVLAEGHADAVRVALDENYVQLGVQQEREGLSTTPRSG